MKHNPLAPLALSGAHLAAFTFDNGGVWSRVTVTREVRPDPDHETYDVGRFVVRIDSVEVCSSLVALDAIAYAMETAGWLAPIVANYESL